MAVGICVPKDVIIGKKERGEGNGKKYYWTEEEEKRAKEAEEWYAEFKEEHHIFDKILRMAIAIWVVMMML